jgi:predicted transcriptional regulator of viral defense system
MNQIEALTKLEALGPPLFETKDVAALLGTERSSATKIATRLANAGFIVKLARGKWALRRRFNTLAVPEHLTSPYPAYISLQSALYFHGIISQIPAVTYAVSLGRSRRYQTALGTFSIHHVSTEFFFGFELDRSGQSKIALPEKALVDLFYFSPTRTRLFTSLPELEIPKNFRWTRAFQMGWKIRSRSRRVLVEERLSLIRRVPAKSRRSRRSGRG